ncbi:YTH1-like cleavage and polyadenylation specificity factor [Hamiltosporidium tvaerminnensis]|uniref:mRNA 3'-end-processing protein n=2 Tax=Hamiltosporidium TaxID=1176354 RepID=A0A4Q9LB90_9MICR|nr:Cleavage and polyadenylation specificity factor subunit 4 [Hamiltosporidium tvaerminnensis]TBU04776.1 YTH1-like cleavage and polyadenylation specificity factor [Hamiltosporidium magnivora]TBU01818.1 YTH1-like cleavage and polyadenylation specificity factor [Hamiltosporidium tvaerminnensis]TBU06888.1 YTH1-like cleavage and polyadenylation specificity factor [Hamiltosporidium magnivora]TBU12304.1 YTH1-like cleavage and polyadenylation specificity factor [Hamiltosporidium tvaerminnensis]
MADENEPTFGFESFIKEKLNLKEFDDIYCIPYQKNLCFNKNCTKVHIKLEKAVVCKHWLRGLCKKGIQCEFLHEYNLKKMPECWFFSKYGECSNPECTFLHIDPNSRSKECLWYKRGFCRHGAMCRNRHIKKKLCFSYFFGLCLAGPLCELGHPKYDIPNPEEQRAVQEKDIIYRPKNLVADNLD